MKSLIGFVVGLAIALSLTLFLGENPWHVLTVLFKSAIGSRYDFGTVLFYSSSLVFTGLAVAIPLQAGLFNIGAEGQLVVGCLGMTMVGLMFPTLPFPISILLSVLAGLLAGWVWGFIPGWLKARKGSHEVILTMMLNFVAAGLANYFIVEVFRNPTSQNPETAMLAPQFQMKELDPIALFFADTPANFSLVVAIVLAVVLQIIFYKSTWGFRLRATGSNPQAAEFGGIQVAKMQMQALALGGMMAAFVGLNEILGSAGKFRLGFSPDYGFVGIAVALMARGRPAWILLSALLFGILQKGASDLDMETATITRDYAKIFQAIIILSVVSFSTINLKRWFKKAAHG